MSHIKFSLIRIKFHDNLSGGTCCMFCLKRSIEEVKGVGTLLESKRITGGQLIFWNLMKPAAFNSKGGGSQEEGRPTALWKGARVTGI